ncbi:hypothetical protein Tco_0049911, partial [Tanacetum coccineum]
SSGPIENVADEVVHKERGDSLVRAATNASSLEAEQDNGNIDKTKSKATLNEPSFSGTSSGSGPSRQETIGDAIAQTGFENVSKLSNDPLLARVLDLEKTKTTQQNEIASLKRRVKNLEQKKRSRTHKLKRLRKGRIDVIEADDDITLVGVHDVNVNAVAQVSAAGDKVSAIGAATTVSVATTTVEELTLAQALADLKSTKLKAKGIAFREPGESTTTKTPIPSNIQNKGKAKMIEPEPMKNLSKKDQLKLDEEIVLKLQAKIDEEERISR